MAKGFFIQYKFILPENIKHSSYTYQKLFRAIYGYTQNVTKSNGKRYTYHRKGVLSDYPHSRPGKNCVIIPKNAFNELTTFFKTGKNPAHFWKIRGDWKAVYYMDEKTLNPADAAKALEATLGRAYVETATGEQANLDGELALLTDLKKSDKVPDPAYVKKVVSEAEKIVQHEWFKDCLAGSEKLSSFYKKYKAVKA